MKFAYVCRGCGSPDITEECGKLINEGGLIVCYDTYVCNHCGRKGADILVEVDAPDELDVSQDKWIFSEERWERNETQ